MLGALVGSDPAQLTVTPASPKVPQNTCGANSEGHSTERAQEGTRTTDPSLLRARTHPTRWALAWEMRNSSETLTETTL